MFIISGKLKPLNKKEYFLVKYRELFGIINSLDLNIDTNYFTKLY